MEAFNKKVRAMKWSLIAIVLAIVVLLVLWWYRPLLVLLVLPVGSTFLFILVDFLFYPLRKAGVRDDHPGPYIPNLRIWGLGLVIGVSTAIFYLLYSTTQDMQDKLKALEGEQLIFWTYVALLITMSIVLGFVVYVIARISATD